MTAVPPKSRIGLKWRMAVAKFKSLQGSPRYVAMGIGIGVFVGVTPTVPFHTALALLLAVALKASKPAAVLGVWFSNPITIVPLYWSCYKFGSFLWGGVTTEFGQIIQIMHSIEAAEQWSRKFSILGDFIRNEATVALSMNVAGIILGILPGIGAYWLTLRVMRKIRQAKS